MRRRQVLSGIVASGALSPLATKTASASGATEYQGIAYDTTTHRTVGPASARIVEAADTFRGTIAAGTRTVPIQTGADPTPSKARSERRRFDALIGGKQAAGGYPLQVRVETLDETVSGYMTYPNPAYGRLGFALVPKSMNNVNLERAVTPKPGASRTVLKNGIPVDSGIAPSRHKPTARAATRPTVGWSI